MGSGAGTAGGPKREGTEESEMSIGVRYGRIGELGGTASGSKRGGGERDETEESQRCPSEAPEREGQWDEVEEIGREEE